MKLKQLFENKVPKLTDPITAYKYVGTQRKRIPELEPISLKDSHIAFLYAKYIINERWPEAEPIIINTSHKGFYYEHN